MSHFLFIKTSGLANVWLAAATISIIAGCAASPSSQSQSATLHAQSGESENPFVEVGIIPAAQRDVVVSGNGRVLMVGERGQVGGKVVATRVWDLETLTPLSGPLALGLFDYGLNVDGTIAFTTDHKHVHVWDVKTSRLKWRLDLDQDGLEQVGISPDGREIVAVSESDKCVKVWEIGNPKPRLVIQQDAISADFDPSGERIVLEEGFTRIVDAKSGRELVPEFSDEYLTGYRKHFDSTGRRYLINEAWGPRVIDASTGKTLLKIDVKYTQTRARWSLDYTQIVLIGNDETVELYDVTTGNRTLSLRIDEVLAFTVLSGGQFGISEQLGKKPIDVWDLNSVRKVQTLTGSENCEVGTTDRILVTTDEKGMVKIWRRR